MGRNLGAALPPFWGGELGIIVYVANIVMYFLFTMLYILTPFYL